MSAHVDDEDIEGYRVKIIDVDDEEFYVSNYEYLSVQNYFITEAKKKEKFLAEKKRQDKHEDYREGKKKFKRYEQKLEFANKTILEVEEKIKLKWEAFQEEFGAFI